MTTSLSKERKFDVVVFGATGVTGSQVAKQLKEVALRENLNWAVAGRRPNELKRLFPDVNVLYADCQDANSIIQMCSQTHSLLNLVGPFRFYGRVVVESCLQTKTNYFDVCGEPEFIEKMAHEFGEEAAKKGIALVCGCGFDSVPADLGVLYNQAQFTKNGGICNSVEAFIRIKTGKSGTLKGNYATWQALIESFTSANDFRKWRKANIPESHIQPIGPKLKIEKGFVWRQKISAWVTPFMGADASVMKRTQLYLASNPSFDRELGAPTQTAAYFQINQRKFVLIFAVFGLLFYFLLSFSFGRSLLLRFSSFFTYGVVQKTPPTEDDLEGVTFQTTFLGKGYKNRNETHGKEDMEIVTTFSGPEPGYIATSKMLIHSYRAIVTYNENSANGKKKIGALTPGIALWGTDFLDRIRSNGFNVSVLTSGPIQPKTK